MDNLSFDGQVLNAFPGSFNGLVFDDGFFDFLGNVFDLGFDSVVVSDGDFSRNLFDSDFFSVFSDSSSLWNSFDFGLILVFNDFLFERNVFNSAFTFNNFFTSVDNCVNNLRSLVSYVSCCCCWC